MQKLRARPLLSLRLAVALATAFSTTVGVGGVVSCASAEKSAEQPASTSVGDSQRLAPARDPGGANEGSDEDAAAAADAPADARTAPETADATVAAAEPPPPPPPPKDAKEPTKPMPMPTTTTPPTAPVTRSPDPAGPIGGLMGSGAVGSVMPGSKIDARLRDKSGKREERSIDGRFQNQVVVDEKPKEEPAAITSTGGTFVHAGTNPFIDTATDALSTFAIDVDTGSFTFARRYLKEGNLPPDAAVRVEEWVNAMHYGYEGPAKSQAVPFAVHVAGAPSPIAKGKHLVRVALQGKRVEKHERAPTSLVFLVDVSGSMQEHDKLPLAKEGLRMLVNQLREDDTVAITTYAGSTQVVLASTPAMNKSTIFKAIDALSSGGGTNMGSGMELAYREATKNLGADAGGKQRTARVIVLSDGDANIGRTGHEEMLKSIRGYVSEGVMMSTVGFGTGNYNDHLMEQLADAGNGNYSYIDSVKTAEKVFVQNLDGTLETIAQDVKIQVEWNQDVVSRYRLVGYENRDVADRDFRNDKKDAGEIGAGHAVTALYEIEMKNADATVTSTANLGTVRIRAKKPRGTKADEIAVAITPSMMRNQAADLDDDAIAASAVALAAEILRGSPYAEGRTLSEAAELLRGAAVGKFAAERNELARELMLVEPRLAHR